MKRAIYITAIIFLISLICISFSTNVAIALQESSESVEGEVKEYNSRYNLKEELIDEDRQIYIKPDYNVTEEAVEEDQEVYIKPDTEAIPDTEAEDEQVEDHYWWEDEQNDSEETIFEDPNQKSHE